jgi:hypothetical protein
MRTQTRSHNDAFGVSRPANANARDAILSHASLMCPRRPRPSAYRRLRAASVPITLSRSARMFSKSATNSSAPLDEFRRATRRGDQVLHEIVMAVQPVALTVSSIVPGGSEPSLQLMKTELGRLAAADALTTLNVSSPTVS